MAGCGPCPQGTLRLVAEDIPFHPSRPPPQHTGLSVWPPQFTRLPPPHPWHLLPATASSLLVPRLSRWTQNHLPAAKSGPVENHWLHALGHELIPSLRSGHRCAAPCSVRFPCPTIPTPTAGPTLQPLSRVLSTTTLAKPPNSQMGPEVPPGGPSDNLSRSLPCPDLFLVNYLFPSISPSKAGTMPPPHTLALSRTSGFESQLCPSPASVLSSIKWGRI